MSMWEVKASSSGNVYLSKQYSNMPDRNTKRSLLKGSRYLNKKCQVYCENSRLTIEATELKAQGEEITNIYSFCAIKMQLYQTKIRELCYTFAEKLI